MRLLETRITTLMYLVGGASAAGLLVALAPGTVLGLLVDWRPAEPLEEVIVRSWGSLVGLLGLALVYGARHAGARRLALLLSCGGKGIFLLTLLAVAPELAGPLAPVVLFDGLAVLLFAAHLVATRSAASRRASPVD